MTTFVLVHGAWGGSHGFRHVRRLLRSEQHDVSTPSLTGVGERIHLSSPLIGLGTHIRDVVNHVLYEDLDKIVLVGFSYGGFVVTGALEHIAERVSHLVYLDAFVPSNGETVWSHIGRVARARIELGQDWVVTGVAREFDSPAEADWMGARRTTHPQGCFTEPVFLSQPVESFSVHQNLHKGDTGAQKRHRQRGFLAGGPSREGVTSLAVLRDSHQSYGRKQQA